MRKVSIGGIAALLLLAILFFVFAPGIVERAMNRVVAVPLKITPVTRQAHLRFDVVDMHADTLLWSRDLLKRSTRGQVDLPRLQDGSYALQIFSSVTKTPRGQNYDSNGADSDTITALAIAQLQPPRTWGSLLQRSLWHAQKLKRAVAASDDQLRLVTTPADLDDLADARVADAFCFHACRRGRLVGAMLSVEGLQSLEGRLSNLDILYGAGFRMAGLAHFFDNEVAGSMHGTAKGGLTPLGRQVVRRMEALGMVVDVAHASHATIADVLKMARRPVVASHGGVQATCRVNRNLTDDEIRGIARTGGVIGIGYWPGAICSTRPEAAAAAIAYVRDFVGIAHVGLGSDFDGAVTTGFDASQVAAITQALLDRGFAEDDIAAVMGGNVLRVLHAGLVPRHTP